MLNPVAVSWIEALRGKGPQKYKQARGKLRIDDKYCCLGVLTDLAVKAKVCKPKELDGSVLCHKVQKWAGLSSDYGSYGKHAVSSLVTDNDSNKKSFRKIADIIESEPEGLFSPVKPKAAPRSSVSPQKGKNSGKNSSQKEMAKAASKKVK